MSWGSASRSKAWFQLIDLLRLLPQYLIALLAATSHILILCFLAGWAWFREYFGTLGLDADLSFDGLLARSEAYIPQGIESLHELFKGTFNDRLGDVWLQALALIRDTQFRYLIAAVVILPIILYLLPLVLLGRPWGTRLPIRSPQPADPPDGGQGNDPRPMPQPRSRWPRFLQGGEYLSIIFLATLAAILALRVGQWNGEHAAKTIGDRKLPRVQLLFKHGSSGSMIEGLEKHVLRKIFSDKTNLYVYSEKDLIPGIIPPIYVISINEISQMRVLHH